MTLNKVFLRSKSRITHLKKAALTTGDYTKVRPRLEFTMSYQESKHIELKIPVSYGYLTAKAWGLETYPPVLALHGYLNNAGSFDKLIPLLSSRLYTVALDIPAHGFSSKKPMGCHYDYMDMLVYIKKVVNFFKWDSFSIIGHSMGGTLALLYGSIFPQSVKNIVLLDIIKPPSCDSKELPLVTAEAIQEVIRIERKMCNPAPVYSMNNILDRYKNAVGDNLTDEAISVLLKRGVQPSPCGKGVVFSRDLRITVTNDLTNMSHDAIKSFVKKLQCNMLIILSSDSVTEQICTKEVNDSFLSIYKKVCNSFQIVEVQGNHFVHLISPEIVAPHIDTFFQSKCNLLSKI